MADGFTKCDPVSALNRQERYLKIKVDEGFNNDPPGSASSPLNSVLLGSINIFGPLHR